MKNMKIPKKVRGINVVQDIDLAVQSIKQNNCICRFEFGDSMKPILNSGEFYYTEKIDDLKTLEIGDAVVCEVNGSLMTHMILDFNKSKTMFLISSSKGEIYGWTNKIYAKAIAFQPRIFIQNFY